MLQFYLAYLRRYLLLAVGLLVGALVGLVYWGLSPIDAKLDFGPVHYAWPLNFHFGESQWGPRFHLLGVTEERPIFYESVVELAVIGLPPSSRWGDPQNRKNLVRQGQDWVPQFRTRSFLEAVNQKMPPQYRRNPTELASMITVKPDWDNPVIEIKVKGRDREEAWLLAQTVPWVFLAEVVNAEKDRWVEAGESARKEMDEVVVKLSEAGTDMTTLVIPQIEEVRTQFLALQERVDSLRVKMRQQIVEFERAPLTSGGETANEELQAITNRLLEAESQYVKELDLAQQEIREKVRQPINRLTYSPEYLLAQAKIEGLSRTLNSLARSLAVREFNEEGLAKNLLLIQEPTLPQPLPPDRMRGRSAVIFGAGLGLGLAWLATYSREYVKGLGGSLSGRFLPVAQASPEGRSRRRSRGRRPGPRKAEGDH